MRKITIVTTLIQYLSYLLDNKVVFSVKEVNDHIEKKDVIDWLEKEFPHGSENGLDFSLWRDNHKSWLHDELYSIWGGYVGQERRKWGIEHNGLCLLISWSIEVIRDPATNDGEVD
ncbi:hypothetical protein [Exiguobacterium mexicanum]|uniref:hypothetical protein n=1 Tax=Exiguobacterium mexicanum TaxID=340146 RepID=UPI00110F1A71|nr:hypothetical protein [Exiguobacterium mexicanum]